MPQMSLPLRTATAIPARFTSQRERVLRILARWEASIRQASLSISPSRDHGSSGPGAALSR